MPQYKNAADVRAAHPGAYDDLTDQQIEQGLAKQAGPAPVNDGALGERFHPSLGDTPDSAFIGELARTGKEAATGLLRSPLDLAKGVVNTVAHPLDTLMSLGHQAMHPVETVENLAANPREAGSLLGQMLLAPKVPGAVAEAPGIVGRGVSAVGRGAEALGTSKALTRARSLAPLELLTGHPVAAAISAGAPTALEYGGRAMQRGGAALEGLTRAVKPVEIPPYESASTEVPANWGWHKMAGDTAERAKAPAVEPNAFTHEGFVNDLKASAGEPPAPQDLSGALAELSNSVRRSKLSPAAKFLEDDPQAAIGGEGRMTGQFEEGDGGLSDVAAGNITPNVNPEILNGLDSRITGLSPLDELATMSGRKLSPARSQELFNKFKGGR